eukprot:TRINITY_DN14448_c0_g2_i1.p1 TRINITY_DN14448_c0_g2~~TRINITY_DN14448_c0_g2_i1.p1  ORF type:complete len:1632 (+),score=579.25 TRINITY_DN14448_c0_g2_i1:1-4896(+)
MGTSLNLESSAQCTKCTAGSYCATTGLVTPTNVCSAGYYCTEGAAIAGPVDGTTGNLCPAGHYCEAGTVDPEPCPAKTYRSSVRGTRVEDCSDCMSGYICPIGTVNPSDQCPAGYYCESGESAFTDVCPIGHYCEAGTVDPQPCAAGTYQDLTNQSTCKTCPKGSYCIEGCSDPVDCPKGFYCPVGTERANEYPCPIGTYGDEFRFEVESDCKDCTGGSYCETSGLAAVTGPCSAGYFCLGGAKVAAPVEGFADGYCSGTLPDGMTHGTGDKCPVGHYCPEETTNPIPCPSGTFNNYSGMGALSDCKACTPGYQCPNQGTNIASEACTAGFQCQGGVSNPSVVCPVGHYCPEGTSDALPCEAGTYQDRTQQTTCKPCPSGYYCEIGTHTLVDCPAGHYCLEGTEYGTEHPCPKGTFNAGVNLKSADECTPCTAGSYCASTGLSAVEGPCTAGYFCLLGAQNSQPVENFVHGYSGDTVVPPDVDNSGDICPKGHYCPIGTAHPIQCPVGTYSNNLGNKALADCTNCDAGYKCPELATLTPSVLCPVGYYCDGGESDFTAICPAGSYCEEGSDQPTPCAATTYQDMTGKSSCEQCPERYFCGEGCDAPEACPTGRYCPAGSSIGILCPVGTYNPNTLLADVAECQDCPSGKYCGTEGLATPSGDCDAGYYCTLKASSSSPTDSTGGECTPGHYCESGSTAPMDCPAGTFSTSSGNTATGDCTSCTPGYTCASGTVTPTEKCLEGFYCSGGDGSPTSRCPIGNYCPTGSSAPVPCEAGTYQDQLQQKECNPCPAGKFCIEGTHTPSECPIGHYCPESTETGDDYPCPRGTYSPDKNLKTSDECSKCTGGHFCPDEGQVQVGESDLCDEGFFCLEGASVAQPVEHFVHGYSGDTVVTPSADNTGDICPKGHYCPVGSTNPTPCPAGTFNNAERVASSTLCNACTPGYHCPNSGTVLPTLKCSAGYYCEGGDIEYTAACPKGSYCPENVSSPIPCPAGTYTQNPGQSSCSTCIAGSYCPENTFDPIDCPKGSYCPAGTKFGTEHLCPRGTLGTRTRTSLESECESCPGGEYCADEGALVSNGDCDAGYYCMGGATQANPMDGFLDGYCGALVDPLPESTTGSVCPKGHYCPAKSSSPTPCPAGTYSTSIANTKLEQCLPCPDGMMCPIAGTTTPDVDCTAGYYCEEGTISASLECTIGHYCPLGSLEPVPCEAGTFMSGTRASSCSQCPKGAYCVEGVSSPVTCPAGSYCPAGTTSSREFLCETGTFSGETGLEKAGDCTICTAGYYCATEGLAAPTGKCDAGFFCKEGAKTAAPSDGFVDGYCGGIADDVIATTGDICPKGHYCLIGTSSPLLCPSGTYSGALGNDALEDCLDCPAGLKCPSQGTVTPTEECDIDYYCPAGTAEPTELCPIGSFCIAGSEAPEECAAGTYQPNTGKHSCLDCPQGYYCEKGTSTPSECPLGSYCPKNTGFSTEYLCPAGTLGLTKKLTAVDGCTNCTGGKYCATPGLSSETGDCAAGYFCLHSATVASPTDGFDSGYSGGVCNVPSVDKTGDICPKGHYCPAGTTSPIRCPIGTFANEVGYTKLDDCKLCLDGYYCPETGTITPTDVCTAGYYCPGEFFMFLTIKLFLFQELIFY